MNIFEIFLIKTHKKRAFIYALIYNLNNVINNSKFVVIFKFLKNMNDCFDSQKNFKLLKHEKNDYAIDLMFDIKSSIEFLYAFSKKN